MRLTCEREQLSQVFQLAAGVAPTRSPKPILENVKLEARVEGVTLMATDLEVGIRIEIPGIEVTAPGDVVLPAKRVGPILRESSDEKLVLESDGSKLRIRGERSEFNLPTQNPEEFPAVRGFEENSYHELPARLFRELLRRTAFATDTESSRYALGGVLLELSEQEIIGVGTDGRRLARQQGPATSVGGHQTRENTVIPTRAIQLMERAMAESEENVQIAARDNDVLVKGQRVTIYTRLVEGRYPKWRDVIPEYGDMGKIELAVGPFYSAVRQAAVVTSEEHRGVEFIFGEGKLLLTAHGAEFGESRIELPIAYDGPETPVRLDPRFVGDFLRVLDPDQTFTFHLRDPESAVVCTTDDGYAYVIMPLSREG
jgi:DNA polymerase-3 subunit beta